MKKNKRLLIILVFSTLAFFCPTPEPAHSKSPIRLFDEKGNFLFPPDFLFGTASSDFQTTGGNGQTDWDQYLKNRPTSKIKPGLGTDFFNHYKTDFDLAGQMNLQIHRLSLEWARLEPQEGQWDKKAIDRYKDILEYLKKQNIEPMICLNHFTLPQWLSQRGGWENPQAPYYYGRYAAMVAEKIGQPLKIRWWLTFNEPQVTISTGYIKGEWPPFKSVDGLQDQTGVARVFKVASHLIDAHRLAYRQIHQKMAGGWLHKIGWKKDRVMVSLASSTGAFYPLDPHSPLDQFAVNILNTVSVLSLDYLMGRVDRDFIGLNYYGRHLLKMHISRPDQPPLNWLSPEKPLAIEWQTPSQRATKGRPVEFYPQGLYDLIMKFTDLGLPIFITENGLNDQRDDFREEFLVGHLAAIHQALRAGAPVIGYQYWALTDSWEWGGHFSQMGLIGIDRENHLKRYLRLSADTYGDIIRTRRLLLSLVKKHELN